MASSSLARWVVATVRFATMDRWAANRDSELHFIYVCIRRDARPAPPNSMSNRQALLDQYFALVIRIAHGCDHG